MAVPAPTKGAAPPPAALDPNAPLTPQNIQAIATYLAGQQVNGPISDITKTIATNQAQTQGATNLTGGYFNQLGQQAGQGVMAQNNIASGLNNQLSGIASGTQGQLQGIGQNAMASLLKYAPQSDPQNSLAAPALGSMATEIARQQGLSAQNSATSRAFGAIQGANFQNLAASNLGTFALRGQEALKGIQQAGQLRNQPLAAKIATLQASRGGLIATNIGKLRQQEITNSIARAGLGIKAVTANVAQQNANSSSQNAGTNALNAANQQMSRDRIFGLDQKKYGDAVAKDNYQRTHGLGPYKPGSPAANKPSPNSTKYLTDLGKIQSAITTWQQQGVKDRKGNVLEPHPTDVQMKQLLGGTYNPVLIQAAFELLGWGHITGTTAGMMHQMGIRGGSFRGQPIQVAPAPNQVQQGVTGSGLTGLAPSGGP
jgi:hypothetical protein